MRKIAPTGEMHLTFRIGDILTNLSGIAIDAAGDFIIGKSDADSGLFASPRRLRRQGS